MTSLHLSGKWDTPDADVRRATLALIEAHKPLAVSHTEAAEHIGALFNLPGFRLFGRGECALHLRDDTLATARDVVLSPLPIPRRNNAQCKALVVEVDASALGPAHTRIVLHLPSGVEGATGIRRNEQGRVWRDCIAGLQRLVATIDGPIVITGDWNISILRRWVRRFLRREFPGFDFRVPPRGTHGRRAIDFSLVRGFTVTASTVLNNPASDHRAVLERMKETVVTRGIYPAAKHLLIPPGSNDPAIVPRVAILHVDAGNAESLHTFFRDRSGGIESHFHIQRDGDVEQYRNIFWQADANFRANDFAVSIETQGFGSGQWTPEQLASIKRLLLWLKSEAGIPLVKCPRWDGAGVGYHVQFGAPGPWTPVAKSCPGPDRIKQFDAALVPWMKSLAPLPPTRLTRARTELEAIAKAREVRHPIQARAIRSALKMLPKR